MDQPTITVKFDGQPLSAAVDILSCDIRRELNRVPEARLTLMERRVGKQAFTLSSPATMLPGKSVTIELQQAGPVQPAVFEGLVLRHALRAKPDGNELRLDLKHAAFKLTRQRRSAVHDQKSDVTVIRDIAQLAQLTVSTTAAGAVIHPQLVQHQATDWDFMLARADACGLLVDVHRSTLTLAEMASLAGPTRQFDYGAQELFEFEFEIDGASQWAAVSGVGWDMSAQQVRGPEMAQAQTGPVGDLAPASMAQQLGGDQSTLHHVVPLSQGELKNWADARLLRSRLALLRGRLVIPCDISMAPLDQLLVSGVGNHVDGPVLISSVVHLFGHDGWKTEVGLGLPARPYAQDHDLADLPAAGLLPPVGGLHIGKVGAYEQDPDGESRVRLKWPIIDGAPPGPIWARVLHADAGSGRGTTFWPREDDEVIVGFLGDDPCQPVILGALHSSAQAAPSFVGEPAQGEAKGALVSARGAVIGYEDVADGKSRLTLSTPDGRHIVLDDDAGSIQLEDQHGNKIVMDQDGILIQTPNQFSVDAQGQVAISGSQVDLQ